MDLKPGLYIVSTPIGNLQDITLRAIETLKNSKVILCEDTRVSQKLLAKFNITSHLLPYNDFSNPKDRDKVRELIDHGAVVSIVSDAGTPLISDPGYKLVRDLKQAGYFIEVVPGVSSPIAALTLSSLPTDKFFFGGFIPKTSASREQTFMEVKQIKATLIFFDTAKRIADTLQVAHKVLGNREACVARELTKLYQETINGTLEELKNYTLNKVLKGEIVLLISGFHKEEVIDEAGLLIRIKTLRSQYSAKDTVAKIYEELKDQFELSKSDLYDMVKNYNKED